MDVVMEYEKDFHSWLMRNALFLRERKFTEIDAEHIAEELEAMGRSEKRELVSRFSVLIAHLLKWKYQAVRRSRSWKNTISTQRIDINDLLEDSPSLRHDIREKIDRAYKKARLKAEDETGIDKEKFPAVCPFSAEEIMNEEFFPEE
ncbi:MAG: hypothetical protein B6245_01915 [Desulfobacteraceae bacterium 4572_88]|nr:MAG: hypothetical protein B6245_01915 [Desulfobacteraceae bacterium 4572_88]